MYLEIESLKTVSEIIAYGTGNKRKSRKSGDLKKLGFAQIHPLSSYFAFVSASCSLFALAPRFLHLIPPVFLLLTFTPVPCSCSLLLLLTLAPYSCFLRLLLNSAHHFCSLFPL